jgi:AraC-like DNA-binding protein
MVSDYFRYFASGPESARWGLGLTAAGHTRVAAHARYPAGQHPTDHHLEWERGRVLEALQIVFIASGRGTFESQATGLRVIEPGMAFVVLPKTWHRYRPDPQHGWTESWIEAQGPTIEHLLRARVFSAGEAVRSIAPESGLEEALNALHQRARSAGPGFSAELAAAALAVLAAWETAGRIHPTRSRLSRVILEAERLLGEQLTEPVNVQALARRLGVGYTHFRRAFKAQTGFAPWQYVLHLRITRARRLLASSDVTLETLAAQLGFSSGFHLSSAFKRAYGVSPERWRRQLARARPADQA